MVSEYYKAAKEAAAVAEKDSFGIVKLTGGERVSWLQGMVTNDVRKLSSGSGCYAAHLTPQGKMIAQMQILADEDALWLSLERAAISKLIAAFDKLIIMEDVQAADVSDEYSILEVLGPKAPQVLEPFGVPQNGLYSHLESGDSRVVVSDLGYGIGVPRAHADHILRSFVEHGATAIDHGTWDVLRTEAGIAIYGVDIDETTTMPELGPRGIDYDKGCYIGQEVVAKVKYIGHVNRRFVGFVCEGAAVPEARSVVQAQGKDVGYVTTGVFSPGLDKPIALGFVTRAAGEPGKEVVLSGKSGNIPAVVASLPLLNRSGD